MDKVSLKAEPRELIGRATDGLKEEGTVPGVLYGPGVENKNLQVGRNALISALETAGGSSLVELDTGEGAPVNVIIKDIQKDPVKDVITHVDFYQVDMTKPVSTSVLLEYVGIAPAVKDLGGTLIKARNTIDVKGLPDKLVASIVVDISKITDFETVIRVGDLELPEGLEFDMDPKRAVAIVNPPRTEAEMAALEEAPEEAELPEGAEEKKEGEEGEGEEKKEGAPAEDKGEDKGEDKKGN
ncbi:MAG: 50S ribosomal protein L25 [Candidatus Uhrbacteria bacterium]|nr:50S ribosomal protein L25 [Patescibacteria group bacterium]MBU1907303.1 50S ribosomal protein L25 [Patescibacteria group bacterium]